MSEGKESISSKIISGVLIAVLAGVILFWFTGAKGILNRPQADIKLSNLTYDSNGPIVPETFLVTISVTAYNQGDATAENCEAKWWRDNLNSDPFTSATKFGIPPGESSTKLIPAVFPYRGRSPGHYHSSIQVICDNTKSNITEMDITVFSE